MNSAKISILMPVYNGEEFLKDSIDSVLKQTFQQWELICIDDVSTDGSIQILNHYAEHDKRIKVIHNTKNIGPLGARRHGFEASTGDYIMYLDADDMFTPNLLATLYIKALETNADSVAPNLEYTGGVKFIYLGTSHMVLTQMRS